MYTTCLFCTGRLGSNDAVEHFPVGRRLAFDSDRGRLWVVCPHCRRWNLSALEERWEALEECERLFRSSRLRVSGERISLAHRPEGLDLIRIGTAPEAEVAAWRYAPPGDAWTWFPGLHERTRAVMDALGSVLPGRVRRDGDPAARLRIWLRGSHAVDTLALGRGDARVLQYRHVLSAELLRPERDRTWGLRILHESGAIQLWGREGLSTLGRILAAANGSAATGAQVRSALRKLEDASDSGHYFSQIAALALRTSWGRRPDASERPSVLGTLATPAERLAFYLTFRSFWAQGGTGSAPRLLLLRLPPVDRLALEMAATEEAERQALDGEIAVLEAEWREAEEIAAIADELFRSRASARPEDRHGRPRIGFAWRGWSGASPGGC
jgi:hypothetical protein